MTDLHARVVAALHEVRESELHKRDCDLHRFGGMGCTCDWQKRVDARDATCVEAAIDAAARAPFGLSLPGTIDDGLAAFLAAAAQKETTK